MEDFLTEYNEADATDRYMDDYTNEELEQLWETWNEGAG